MEKAMIPIVDAFKSQNIYLKCYIRIQTMPIDIRERIRTLRAQKGLSMEMMARKMNITRPFYSQLEGGKRRISVEYLEGIARAMNMTVAELYSESPLQNVEKPLTKTRHLRPVNTAELRAKLEPLLGNQTADFMTCYQLWSHAPEKMKQQLQEAEKILR